ncbi:MAG: cytochrome c3 family protein [Desulfuromonadales bacterium]|nr:cytochrome c3 family protein [Desulfuromonadales bacterium]
MKKFLILLALLSISATAFAGLNPGTGVVGSLHDMNTITGAADDVEGRVCAFCHTPHHAIQNPAADYLPLWAHELNTSTSFAPYSTVTIDAAIVDPFIGPSRLCMSCHDGVIAADQHYNFSGTPLVVTGDSWGQRAVGTKNAAGEHDFSNDHPIGFQFDAALVAADGELFDPVGNDFEGNTYGVQVADVLTDGFMTCATCHDVHNSSNASHTLATKNYFVYSPQEGSQLCLTCHAKGEEKAP